MATPSDKQILQCNATLESLRREIDVALDESVQGDIALPTVLIEAMRYSLLAPGKRFRPLLTLLAGGLLCGDYRRAMPAAVAVEMVHAYSLIHDDLPAMDDDDVRRGQPTCHIRFGEANAILAGDALLTLAFEHLSRSALSPDVICKTVCELATAAGYTGMVAGQVDDLNPRSNQNQYEMVWRINQRKTARLLRASLVLGGICCGASTDKIEALGKFGDGLGLAFQIVDDLLDVEGTAGELGKRVGKDIDRGKLNFVSVYGIRESRRQAELQIKEALEAIAPLANGAIAYDCLVHLAQLTVNRKK